MVAELSFGSWRFLTTKKYSTTLWTSALHRAFPHGDTDIWTWRQQMSRLHGNMTFIRNHAAHLEPMFRRDVERDLAQAQTLMDGRDPHALAWLNDMAKLETVIASKPSFLT